MGFFDDLTPEDAYALHGTSPSGVDAVAGPSPTKPEEPGLFALAGSPLMSGLESMGKGIGEGVQNLFGLGHDIDVGLGKVTGMPGPMSETFAKEVAPLPGEPSAFEQPGVPSWVSSFAKTISPTTPFRAGVEATGAISPEAQKYTAAAARPPAQLAGALAVDPVAYAPFGALSKFGRVGEALGAAISAGFAGQMGYEGIKAGQDALDTLQREGVTPETIQKASGMFAALGMAGLAGAGAVREARGALAPPEAAPAPGSEVTAPSGPPPEIPSGVPVRINKIFELAKDIMDEKVAAGIKEGRTPKAVDLRGIGENETTEHLLRRGQDPGAGDITMGAQEAPKVNLVVVEPGEMANLPENIRQDLSKAKSMFDPSTGNLYVTRKTVSHVLKADNVGEAVQNAVEILSHEYTHALEKTTGQRKMTRTFDPMTGEEIPIPREQAGQKLSRGGRAMGGHARGEAFQDIPTDVQNIATSEALKQAVMSDPRMQNVLRIAQKNPEIAAALSGAGEGALPSAFTEAAGRIGEAATGRGLGPKGKPAKAEAFAEPKFGKKPSEKIAPPPEAKLPVADFDKYFVEEKEAAPSRSNEDIAADMIRERAKTPEDAEALLDRLVRAKYIPEESRAAVREKFTGKPEGEPSVAPPKMEAPPGMRTYADIIKHRTDKWRGVDYDERTRVYQRLQKLGGPTKENLEKIGVTPEEFKSWHLTNNNNWQRQRVAGKIDPRAQAMRDIYTSKEFRVRASRELGLSPRQLGVSPGQERAISEGREAQLPPSQAIPGTEGARLRDVQQTAGQLRKEVSAALKSKDLKKVQAAGEKVSRIKQIMERIKGAIPWRSTQAQNLENISKGMDNAEARLGREETRLSTRQAKVQAKALRAAPRSTELESLRKEVADLREQVAKRKIKKPAKAAEEIEAEPFRPEDEGKMFLPEKAEEPDLVKKVLERRRSPEELELEKREPDLSKKRTLPSLLKEVRATERRETAREAPKNIVLEAQRAEQPRAKRLSKKVLEKIRLQRERGVVPEYRAPEAKKVGPVYPKPGELGPGGIRKPLAPPPPTPQTFGERGEPKYQKQKPGDVRDFVEGRLTALLKDPRWEGKGIRTLLNSLREEKITPQEAAKVADIDISKYPRVEERITPPPRIASTVGPGAPELTPGEVTKIPGKELPKKYRRRAPLAERKVPAGGALELPKPGESKEAFVKRVKFGGEQTYETFEEPTTRAALTREALEGPRMAQPTALGRGGKAPEVLPEEPMAKYVERLKKKSIKAGIEGQLATRQRMAAGKSYYESTFLSTNKDIRKVLGEEGVQQFKTAVNDYATSLVEKSKKRAEDYAEPVMDMAEAKAQALAYFRNKSGAVRIGDKVYSLKQLDEAAREAHATDMTPRLSLGERPRIADVIPGRKASQALTGYKVTRGGDVIPSEGSTASLEAIAAANPTKGKFNLALDNFVEGLKKRGILSPGKATVEYRRRALNYYDSVHPVKSAPPPGMETPRDKARRVLGLEPEEGPMKLDEKAFDKAGALLKKEGLGELSRMRRKWLHFAARGGGVAKSAMTGADLSNPLRQTLVLTAHQALHDPGKLMGNLRDMVLSYSGDRYSKMDLELKNSKQYQLAKKAGVNLIDKPQEHDAFLGVDLIDNLIKKGLSKGKWDPRKWVAELGEKGIVGAARAYTHYQNEAMVDGFARGIKFLKNHDALDEHSIAQMADLINVFGSRTPVKSADIANAMNAVLFSPQMLKSRGRFMAHLFIDHGVHVDAKTGKIKAVPFGFATYESKAVRQFARRSVRDTIAFGSSLLAMGYYGALMAGANPHVEMDPRSTDFLKLRLGHVTVDPWGGYQQYFRFVVQEAMGQEKLRGSGRVQQARRAELAGRFIRGKLSPLAGLTWSGITGQTAEGREFRSPGAVARGLAQYTYPLNIQDIVDTLQESPPALAPFIITLATLGAGVQGGGGAKSSWLNDAATRAADTRVSDEVSRLKLEPPRISGRIGLPGRTPIGTKRYYTLNPEEREKFVSEVMPIVSKDLDEFISSKEYNSLNDAQKRRALYHIISRENRRYSAAKKLKQEYRYAPAKNDWWEETQ